MTRWKLTLEYDGGEFSGWQRQREALSVQQVIEDAFLKFTGETVTLHVAGRTDTGVHAAGQVAHVDLESAREAHEIEGALNFHMRPHKVVIVKAEAVSEAFHARFGATKRFYRYVILNRRAPSALLAGRVWHLSRPLALAPMQEAATLLLGRHDFSTFRAAGCQASGPVRTLDTLSLAREGEAIVIETSAKSFLYHQVRNMVGSLALVGGGSWSVADFQAAFQACDRTKGGPTAPPDGLTFMKVAYESEA